MKLFLTILGGIVAIIALIILGVWLSVALSSRPGPAAEPLVVLSSSDLQAAIEGIAAERKLVGVAAKVMVGGDIVAEAQTGWRTKEEQDALQASDLFHIGSIGKSMSATTIATLVEDGVMSWDETLGQRLSDIPMDTGWRNVTLSQLLTHTASAPRAGLGAMIRKDSDPQALHALRRELAAEILSNPPTVPPGTAFAYSNEGFMLASLMAEDASGQAWETLIRTRLARPLGLTSLGFGVPTSDNRREIPWGHRKLGPVKIAMAPTATADNPPWMAAAGTMHMSLDDLLAYGRAHLEAGATDDALLSEETFAQLQTPVMNDYAYGWVVQSRDFGEGEDLVIWHNGSNTMWYAVLVLLPRRDAAIVIVTNDGSGLSETQRAFDALASQIATVMARPS